MELLVEHLGHGLALSLMLSLPAVLIAASVGLVVGILQAVTQVQEQTISAAPKILAVFLSIMVGGGLMLNALTDYVRESVNLAFNEVPQSGDYILPPLDTDPGRAKIKSFFKEQLKNGKIPSLKEFEKFPSSAAKDNAKQSIGVETQTKAASPLGISENMSLQKKGR